MMSYKYKIFFIMSVLVLFLNGMFNIFSIAKWGDFWYHQADSASLVLSDLIIDDSYPELSELFFQTFVYVEDKQKNIDIVPPENIINTGSYISHIGLQTTILMPIFKLGTRILFKDDQYSWWKSYKFTQAIVAFATAVVLALFLTFLAVEFGLFPVTIMGLWVTFTNVWITIFARNIYWMTWSWFLPVLVTMYFLYKNNHKPNIIMYILVFLTIALKSSMGYEYVTTIMVMTTLPIFYFAISRRWTFEEFNSIFIKISLTCIVALTVTIAIHALLLGGSERIMQHLYWRTINTETGIQGWEDSFKIHSVLGIYLFGFAYVLPFATSVLSGIGLIILRTFSSQKFTVVRQCFGEGIKIDQQKTLALYVVVFLGFIGAMSHHIIFKQHSGIHSHMNFVLWYMPFWFLMSLAVLLAPTSYQDILSTCKETPLLQIFIRKKYD